MQRLRVVTFSLAAFLLGGCDQPRHETSISPIVTTNTTPAPAHAHTNRLAREKSPYLLQHQYNPVDWYPWGDEAFAKARRENKPIFLSIGYSTCHWCHVMERESFEDETVAQYLNDHFVSIKVDREERPDVDKIYMTFVQATTGSGGWPLNVFLTPELKPFFGGTYWPPETRQGRGSFMQVLQQIVKVWSERHGEIAASADEMHARLKAFAASTTATNLILAADEVRQAGTLFKDAYDPKNGGFGSAPKFPQPSQPLFLLRYAKRFADDEATQMVLHTCDKMAAGGIHDQLGGGFARYSVDAQWLVPHFEKMLYDNAQLVQLYLDAYLISGEPRHADVARDILDYVLRDMTHPQGGFYSAEDADSEGHEGKFYCWTYDELSKLLSPEEFNVAVSYFGITKEGNFVDHSHPSPLPGQNVLSVVKPLAPSLSPSDGERVAKGRESGSHNDTALLASAKEKMINARNRRIRPHLDDKVLASWNGLMLGAFARAGVVLNEPKYLAAAEKNSAFIRKTLWDAQSKSLFHRWRDGQRDNVELLNGYACMLDGVIHLYEATLNPEHLQFAIALADAMIAKFYDAENGGFWQSTASATDLIVRSKEDYDGAEPSGNSVATLALLKLAAITDRDTFRKPAEATLRWSAARLQKSPQAVPYMLHALDFWLQEPHRVVIAGAPDAARSQELARAAHSVYQPNKVVLGNTGPVEEFAKTLPEKNGPVVYLCTGTECKAPTVEPEKVRALLN